MDEKEITREIAEKSLRLGAEKIIEANANAYKMYSTGKEIGAYVSGYSKGLAEGINLAIEMLSELVKEAREDKEPKVTYMIKGVSN